MTKANPSHQELAPSSSFSNKQIVVAANPTPLSTKSRYWQKDINQPILVIEREFFLENPREIACWGRKGLGRRLIRSVNPLLGSRLKP